MPNCKLVALSCLIYALIQPLTALAQGTATTPTPQTQPAPATAAPQEAQQANDTQISQQAQQAAEQAKEEAQQIEKDCGYDPAERNAKKRSKANACMYKAIRLRQRSMELDDSVHSTINAEAMRTISAPQNDSTALQAMIDALNDQQKKQTKPGVDNGSANNFYGGSLSNTPTTCGKGAGAGTATAINNPNLIRVHRSILAPQTAEDDFGYRLGHQFIVYQVTIENGSKDYQFMLQDVTIDFSKHFHQPEGSYQYSASGQDLTLLRGVPEVGADLDPRSGLYHLLQGIGSVAGAVSGLTSFAEVMGPSVAIFNGSFLQGYNTLLPDHSATQLNRLSDSAFIVNTIISKQGAKAIAMFIPTAELLPRDKQREFRNDPNHYLGFNADDGLLNGADVCVDGTFIQAVAVTGPTLISATLEKTPTPTQGQPAFLDIVGTNFVAGDTQVILSGNTPASFPVIVASDGKSGTAQVTLPTDFDVAKTTALLQSKSNPTLKSTAITMKIAN